MAIVRPFFCELKSQTTPAIQKAESREPGTKLRVADQPVSVSTTSSEKAVGTKIMLQPRLCTLRTYSGSDDRVEVIRSGGGGDDDMSRFFATLSEYIESSKKSQDFEIISGRLAMIVFAATVTREVVTGNSLFGKTDLQGISEAVAVCACAVTCAAVFAWFSSARNNVGTIFNIRCNAFIDSFIDQIVDGLFYDTWSDDI